MREKAKIVSSTKRKGGKVKKQEAVNRRRERRERM